MRILVTYDLSKKWDEVKDRAIKSGFEDRIVTVGGSSFKLPNTCLLLPGTDANQVLHTFIGIVRLVDPTIKVRAATFDWSNCQTHEDEPGLGLLGSLLESYKR